MQVYIDESGDDGQVNSAESSRHYTLGAIALEKEKCNEKMTAMMEEMQKAHVASFGYRIRPELSWKNMNDKSREFVAKNLLTRPEFLPIIITTNKFDKLSGWSSLGLNERQFRTYVLRSLLWIVCASANLRPAGDEINLEFDQELAESFHKPINDEAKRIKTKQVRITVGVDSRNSFGIQIADCLAGCYNHYVTSKSAFYKHFRQRVCEIQLVADSSSGVLDIKQIMRVTDLQKLMF